MRPHPHQKSLAESPLLALLVIGTILPILVGIARAQEDHPPVDRQDVSDWVTHRKPSSPPPQDRRLGDAMTFELPAELPAAVEVKDPIFALLIGLVDEDIYGTIDQKRLQEELARRDAKSKLPYEHVLHVTRVPADPDQLTSEVRVRFDGPLKLAVPYSILGYNPGSFRASEECTFREWALGDQEIIYQKKDGDTYTDIPVLLEDVHLFGVTQGAIDLDIDGWIDRVMGGSLDDTAVVALMLCRYEGVWHGWAMGYNKDNRGRSGALDFREDSIVFPSPSGFKAVGRKMRSRAEALLRQTAMDVGATR